jgi:ABC-type methionine transport system permease subunit
VTPYRVDWLLDVLHTAVTLVLFTCGLLLGAWLAWVVLVRASARACFVGQAGAGLGALAAQLGWHDYMVPSELAFRVALAALIVAAAARLGAPRGQQLAGPAAG